MPVPVNLEPMACVTVVCAERSFGVVRAAGVARSVVQRPDAMAVSRAVTHTGANGRSCTERGADAAVKRRLLKRIVFREEMLNAPSVERRVTPAR